MPSPEFNDLGAFLSVRDGGAAVVTATGATVVTGKAVDRGDCWSGRLVLSVFADLADGATVDVDSLELQAAPTEDAPEESWVVVPLRDTFTPATLTGGTGGTQETAALSVRVHLKSTTRFVRSRCQLTLSATGVTQAVATTVLAVGGGSVTSVFADV